MNQDPFFPIFSPDTSITADDIKPVLDLHTDVNGSTSSSSSESAGRKGKRATSGNSLTEDELHQRRRAQNRAAQRAFRERKEGKLKELSTKLNTAESEKQRLERELLELKQRNMMLDMQNRLLQKNGSLDGSTDGESGISGVSNEVGTRAFTFPDYTREQFIEGSVDLNMHPGFTTTQLMASKQYTLDQTALLTVSAVWDYLVEFAKLNDDLELDLPAIMDDLRGNEVCHGFGPAYKLQNVKEVLQRHALHS